jgi:predicted MFS family arabinose efflux permease
VALLVLAPVAWLAIRRPHVATAARGGAVQPLGERLRFLVASPVFHALFWSFTICGFTTAGVIEVHLIPYAVACGYAPFDGSLAYGVLSGFNMLGMVGAGWLSDRVNRPLLLGTIYIGRGLAFLVLMQITGSPALLFAFAVAFGIFDYSTVPVTASLVASHLGVRIMGLTMGLLSAGHALGGAAGAFAGGRLYDLFARYDFVWIAALVLALAAGLMCFTIRERRVAAQAA